MAPISLGRPPAPLFPDQIKKLTPFVYGLENAAIRLGVPTHQLTKLRLAIQRLGPHSAGLFQKYSDDHPIHGIQQIGGPGKGVRGNPIRFDIPQLIIWLERCPQVQWYRNNGSIKLNATARAIESEYRRLELNDWKAKQWRLKLRRTVDTGADDNATPALTEPGTQSAMASPPESAASKGELPGDDGLPDHMQPIIDSDGFELRSHPERIFFGTDPGQWERVTGWVQHMYLRTDAKGRVRARVILQIEDNRFVEFTRLGSLNNSKEPGLAFTADLVHRVVDVQLTGTSAQYNAPMFLLRTTPVGFDNWSDARERVLHVPAA